MEFSFSFSFFWKLKCCLNFVFFTSVLSDSFSFFDGTEKSCRSLCFTVCQLSLPLSFRRCQLSYCVSWSIQFEMPPWLKGIQKCTSKMNKNRQTHTKFLYMRTCVFVCGCVYSSHWVRAMVCVCLCVRVLLLNYVKYKTNATPPTPYTKFSHTKINFSCNQKKKIPFNFCSWFLDWLVCLFAYLSCCCCCSVGTWRYLFNIAEKHNKSLYFASRTLPETQTLELGIYFYCLALSCRRTMWPNCSDYKIRTELNR